jgi:protein TonB
VSAVSPLDAGAGQRHLAGWTASLLVHGGAAGIAVLLVTGIQAPPPKPFQWNVSIMEPVPVSTAPAATQAAAPQSPVAPAQPVTPSEPAPAPVRMMETPSVTQPPPADPVPAEPAPAPRHVPVEEPPPVTAQAPAPEPAPVVARATPAPPSAPTAQEPVATVSRTAPVEPAAATPAAPHSPVPSSAAPTSSAKRDYGWLAEALWGRIEQLKRYPATARLNRWEGKVVLRAVIKEDGRVADLRIAQSSGHDVLDQDALGLMQQASPIPLKQPLGHPQVVVHIPISYKLEQ